MPRSFIVAGLLFLYNSIMEAIIEWLVSIGWKETEIAYIKAHYNEPELRDYLQFLRAVYDDRREYVD